MEFKQHAYLRLPLCYIPTSICNAIVNSLYLSICMQIYNVYISFYIRAIMVVLSIVRDTRRYIKEKTIIPDLFVSTVAKYKSKPAILFEDEVWTFQDLEDYSNAVANYFRNEGFSYGDTVAIVLENSPEYVALWLGMAKIGVHGAFINTNLRGDALLHCVTVSDAKAVVYGKQFGEAIAAIASSLVGR